MKRLIFRRHLRICFGKVFRKGIEGSVTVIAVFAFLVVILGEDLLFGSGGKSKLIHYLNSK